METLNTATWEVQSRPTPLRDFVVEQIKNNPGISKTELNRRHASHNTGKAIADAVFVGLIKRDRTGKGYVLADYVEPKRFVICKDSPFAGTPYAGASCAAAGVEPGKIYLTEEEAKFDMQKLVEFNPHGLIVKEAPHG